MNVTNPRMFRNTTFSPEIGQCVFQPRWRQWLSDATPKAHKPSTRHNPTGHSERKRGHKGCHVREGNATSYNKNDTYHRRLWDFRSNPWGRDKREGELTSSLHWFILWQKIPLPFFRLLNAREKRVELNTLWKFCETIPKLGGRLSCTLKPLAASTLSL